MKTNLPKYYIVTFDPGKDPSNYDKKIITTRVTGKDDEEIFKNAIKRITFYQGKHDARSCTKKTFVSIKESPGIYVEDVASMMVRTSNYRVNIDWDDLERNIERYNKDYGFDLEPDFQRFHVWTEDQQRGYIEFILRGGKSGKEIHINAAGWQGNGDVGRMVLVDGLQRITAVRKFLRNELSIFDGFFRKDFFHIDSMTAGFIFNINDLATRVEVLNWYLDFNAGGTQHTNDEIERVKNLLKKEQK